MLELAGKDIKIVIITMLHKQRQGRYKKSQTALLEMEMTMSKMKNTVVWY